ncbi:MAG: pilin [Candidatus Jorgensenbacteria bacterium]|nr:pilin [Candidatus Jorgensenbacteria bacterium]
MKKFLVLLLLVFTVMFTMSGALAYGQEKTDPSATSQIVDINFPCPAGQLGQDCTVGVSSDTSFIDYIKKIYQFGIAIAGILAVGMIIAGGIYISATTGDVTKAGLGREMITSAIWGIVLLFGTYLILNTINPELVTLKEPYAPQKTVASSSLSLGAESKSCGDPASILYLSEVPGEVDGCQFRKTVTTKQITLSANAGDKKYYYLGLTTYNISIPISSIVWSYPYFIKGSVTPSESAKCLIYAYQPPDYNDGKQSVQSVQLRDDLSACIIEGQQITSLQGEASYSSDAALRAELEVNKNITINKLDCPTAKATNCTSLSGMPNSVITFLKEIPQNCEIQVGTKPLSGWPPCQIEVTGGTEEGHNTHGPGEPIFDVVPKNRSNELAWDVLGKYLIDNPRVTKLCVANDKDFNNLKAYASPSKVGKLCRETGADRHFHVQLAQ